MTPPTGMAVKTPFQPKGMNPPPAVKLPGWNATISRTMTARTGTAIFHQTVILLVSDSHLTPITLMIEKISIITTATAKPGPVTHPALSIRWTWTYWLTYPAP